VAERPSADDIAKWHRWFAIESNNRAWDLAEKADRSALETDQMLEAAHAAALHWRAVGTELNVIRARLLLAHVLALAGDGALALPHARASFDYLTSRASPDWEVAHAHAALANAARASGDRALFEKHYREAARLGAAIANPKDKEIFMASFVRLPQP